MAAPGPARTRRCGACGSAMRKANAVHGGVAYCKSCYRKIFRATPCRECGKNVWTPGGTGEDLCRSCRNKKRTCARCGRPVPRAHFTTASGEVACTSCAPYVAGPRKCPACGVEKHRLDKADSEGRRICAACHRKTPRTYVCLSCGKPDAKVYTRERCWDCHWTQSVRPRAEELAAGLATDRGRELFLAFLSDRTLGQRLVTTDGQMERYRDFFRRVEEAGPGFSGITPEVIERALEEDAVSGRFDAPLGFLERSGLLEAEPDRKRIGRVERRRQRRLLCCAKGDWYGPILSAYRDRLEEDRREYEDRGWGDARRGFGHRSVSACLFAAKAFLRQVDEAGVADVRQVSQEQLNAFLASTGYRYSIGRFVRYLHEEVRLFRRLKMHTVAGHGSVPVLGEVRRRELLDAWLHPPEDGLREAVVGLLLLLYAQQVRAVVRMKRSDVVPGERGKYLAKLGGTPVEFAPQVSEVFGRYLRQLDAASPGGSPQAYLFPGRRPGRHLSGWAVGDALEKRGVHAAELYATALTHAYLAGIRIPTDLVSGLGVCDSTAVRYFHRTDQPLTRGPLPASRAPAGGSVWVYLLECEKGRIYTGIGSDPDSRLRDHLEGHGAKFTGTYPPKRRICALEYKDRAHAALVEKRVKKLRLAERRLLGEAVNGRISMEALPGRVRSAVEGWIGLLGERYAPSTGRSGGS